MSHCNYILNIKSDINDSMFDAIINTTMKSGETLRSVFNDTYNDRTMWCYDVRWREDEDDMRELSRQFPQVLFELSVVNLEDEDDEAYWFIRDGKRQVSPVIKTHEAFNENKLERF